MNVPNVSISEIISQLCNGDENRPPPPPLSSSSSSPPSPAPPTSTSPPLTLSGQTYQMTDDHQQLLDPDQRSDLPLSPSITPPMGLSPTGQSSTSLHSVDDLLIATDPSLECQVSNVPVTSGSLQAPTHLSYCDNSKVLSDLRTSGQVVRGGSNGRFGQYRACPTSSVHPYRHHHHHHGHRHSNSSVLRPINQSSSSADSQQSDSSSLDTTPADLGALVSNSTSNNVELQIDTSLANRQSRIASSTAAVRSQPVQRRTQLAKQILSVIRKGDFNKFMAILSGSKPDLNVFLNGQTALHYCLMFGRDVSWCRELIENGANPNLSSQDGWHPIHLAAFRGLKDNLNYLLSCNQANHGLGSHHHHHHHQNYQPASGTS